ncbi:MAG: ABC transporter ATP-binding protein [Ignavibacteriaceae bacterium]|jgi:lipoprotein-releasing system ATP-binding protein|nr:ABC transporter ATP-binding protein [Ignavibacteriaceae bacterium]
MNIIKAENIYKSYDTGLTNRLEILKNISIEIPKNKISVIIGASGAGKSTLLHIIGGLDKPDKGKILIDENDVSSFSDKKLSSFRNTHIGFVFQFHHLLPEFTALENVTIPQLIGNISFGKATKKAKELLEAVGLAERLNHKPAQLSGGEQQRVAVARALVNDPQLILADEPTGNLDTENSDALNKLFVELRDKFNKTLVIVTHNKDLMALADFIFEMKDGKLTE